MADTEPRKLPNTGIPTGGELGGLFLQIFKRVWRGDIAFAIGVVLVLMILIVPMPKWLLDVGLAISLTFSVMVLMTALFVERPVEFTVFPTILLLATVLRLALNLASTRLILSDGHQGTDAAGDIIAAFGGFIMGDNFVIGIIVFAILVLVNFIVITKGSGRIAEVAARFTLDSMPGKQMAIDADLSTGAIDDEEARTRRRQLEEESSFYGAMDGASKFVRGDAIAGMLITFINVIGGMIIGVAQKDISFAAAADSYTRLTVGDGLISQIPALIVSTAAGMVVTKAGLREQTDKVLFNQLAKQPRPLAMVSFLTAALATLPGIPAIPFLSLSVITGLVAWTMFREHQQAEKATQFDDADGTGVAGDDATLEEDIPISDTLRIDQLRLELGYGLLTLINVPRQGQRLTDQIKSLRRQIAADLGFVMPSVRIQDNMQLAADSYVVKVKEIEAGRGEMRANQLLIMDPRGEEITLPGEQTREPTFGLPAMWIDESTREEALFRGYTVVDPSTVVTTHLTEIIKNHMGELLSYVETQNLLDDLDKDHQKMVQDIIPAQISVAGLQRVLQYLLAERISIRDLPTILEAVSESAQQSRSALMMSEHVRGRLSRQISDMHTNEDGIIPLVTLSPQWEQTFAEHLVGQGDELQLSLPPQQLQEFITALRTTFERQAMEGMTPVLLTSPAIRPYVRSIVERFRSTTPIISQNEVHSRARIRTVAQI